MMRIFSLASIAVALGLGCGSAADNDAGLDSGSADAGVGDAGLDAGMPCPNPVRATFGAAGGTLEHCDGARLEIPPGAVAEGTELSIERLEESAVPAISAPYVLAGPAFAFASDTALTGRVRVVLPHEGGERMEMAVLFEGAWAVVEVCDVEESIVAQTFGALGTFAAAHDPTPYPDGPSGLGSGAIDFDFGAVSASIDIGTMGHAIDEDIGPGRSLTLLYRRSDAAGLEQVDLRFGIDETGAVSPLQLAYANTATSEIWDVLEPLHPGQLMIELTSDDGTAIEGTIDATLHLGDQTRAFSATFTASSVEWRYPPERVCEIPEG
jgi:hypothetical protein